MAGRGRLRHRVHTHPNPRETLGMKGASGLWTLFLVCIISTSIVATMAEYSPSVSCALPSHDEGHNNGDADSALAAALDEWTEELDDDLATESQAAPAPHLSAVEETEAVQPALEAPNVARGPHTRGGILSLPQELLTRCLSFMSAVDLCALAQCCRSFRRFSAEQVLWRRLYCARWGKPREQQGDASWKALYQAKDADDGVRWAVDDQRGAVDQDDPMAAMYREMQRARRQQTLGRGHVEDTMEVPRGALQEQLESWRRTYPPVPPGQPPRPTHTVQQPTHSIQQPTHSIQQPTHSIQQPTHSIQQPPHSIQQPTHSIQQPPHTNHPAPAGPSGSAKQPTRLARGSSATQIPPYSQHNNIAGSNNSRATITLSDESRYSMGGPSSLHSSPVSERAWMHQSPCSTYSETQPLAAAAAAACPASSSQSNLTALQQPGSACAGTSAGQPQPQPQQRGQQQRGSAAAASHKAPGRRRPAPPPRAQCPPPAGAPRSVDEQQLAQRPALGQFGRDAFTWDKLGDYFCCRETGWIHLCDQSCIEGVIDPSSGLFVCPISCRTVDRMLTDWDLHLADSAREGHEEHEVQDADFGGFVGRFYERGYNCRTMKELRDLHCGLRG